VDKQLLSDGPWEYKEIGKKRLPLRFLPILPLCLRH
jgi:hypothetical protein